MSEVAHFLCTRAGCREVATHYPFVSIWAKGHDRTRTRPLALAVPLPHCDACRAFFSIEDLLSAELRRSIRVTLLNHNYAQPDFASAELEWRLIGDQAWRASVRFQP